MSVSAVRRCRIINADDAPKAAEFIMRFSSVPSRLADLLPGLLRRLILEELLSGVVVEYFRDHDPQPEFAAFGSLGLCQRDVGE